MRASRVMWKLNTLHNIIIFSKKYPSTKSSFGHLNALALASQPRSFIGHGQSHISSFILFHYHIYIYVYNLYISLSLVSFHIIITYTTKILIKLNLVDKWKSVWSSRWINRNTTSYFLRYFINFINRHTNTQ